MRQLVIVLVLAVAGCKAAPVKPPITPTADPTPVAKPTLVGQWIAPGLHGGGARHLDIHQDHSFVEVNFGPDTFRCVRAGVLSREDDTLYYEHTLDHCDEETEHTETLVALTVDSLSVSYDGEQSNYTRRAGAPLGTPQQIEWASAPTKPGALDPAATMLIGSWSAPSESGWLQYDIDIYPDGRFIEVWYKEGAYDCTRSGAVVVAGDQMTFDLLSDPCIDRIGAKTETLHSVAAHEFQVSDGHVILVYKRR